MKKTFSLELLVTHGARRLFTAHWTPLCKDWIGHFGPKDYCVFSDVSMPGPAEQIAEFLQQNAAHPENFFFLCNDPAILKQRLAAGLKAVFVNQNAFLDDRVFTIDPAAEKQYDVVYNARLRPVKRHALARRVGEVHDLALIVGFHTPGLGSIPEEEVPKTAMRNAYQLLPSTVCRILNQCRVGIILSHAEGACFASSEYLLCGLPVVSTPSTGGRDVWYDDTNSIIAEPDEDAILEAVSSLLNEPRDPHAVRETHLRRMHAHRQKFMDVILSQVFPKVFAAVDAERFFDAFEYRRFMVFQNKHSWKTPEFIADAFQNQTFEAAVKIDDAAFLH